IRALADQRPHPPHHAMLTQTLPFRPHDAAPVYRQTFLGCTHLKTLEELTGAFYLAIRARCLCKKCRPVAQRLSAALGRISWTCSPNHENVRTLHLRILPLTALRQMLRLRLRRPKLSRNAFC